MVLELATVLLGACVGAIAVLYAAPRGYLGHRKTKAATPAATPPAAPVATPEPTPEETYAPTTEQAPEVPVTEAPAVAEPAPSPEPEPAPLPALYETVQPAPAPVTYTAPSTTSFGAPTLAKKPTRTYRRRTVPARSASGSKKSLTNRPKKR